jgi:hypothetical protein
VIRVVAEEITQQVLEIECGLGVEMESGDVPLEIIPGQGGSSAQNSDRIENGFTWHTIGH